MGIILEGIITGLLLSIFVGATFFVLIETSMSRGFKAALWFDLGVLICDSLIIVAVYFFTAAINRVLVGNYFFNIAGSIAFIVFGANYIFARRKEEPHIAVNNTKVYKLILNGFFINLLNPAVIIFWLGSMAVALTHFKLSGKQAFVYFATIMTVVAILDVTKAYFAYRLSHILNPRLLRGIKVMSGVIMIGFGIYILFG
jgi:threonine/homoserine/homoserine lactone efflux protein